ncbi:MAG: transglutaminase-like domain-containing protein [Archaeoglobaceae archaeon]
MKRLFLILVPLILAGCLSFELSREEYCSKAWRWDLECALNLTLTDEEVKKIGELAESLRGNDCVESSWNVLEWVEENIEYDNFKAQLSSPIIITKGKEIMVQNPDRIYQTPIETVKIRRGICGDYAILIAAFMINLNCKPYVLRFEFTEEETGHLAVGLLLDQYYVLDQKLPPMDLGSYYKKWLHQGKRINRTYIYDYGLLIGEISANEMRNLDYNFSSSDLRFLKDRLRISLREYFREDSGIPQGYWEYLSLKITFQNYADFYTPVFAEKFAEKISKEVLRAIKEYKKDWKAFKLEISQISGDLVVEVQLAK